MPHHHHDHSHSHHHAPEVGTKNETAVLVGFLLTAGFMFAEVIGGLLSGSLALLADAGHMLTDAAALALAWAAFRFGRRAGDAKRSFGYMRFEVLAGLLNAITLIALVVWIAYEAVLRLFEPGPILAGPMAIVASMGLVVNGLVFWTLSRSETDHVNIKGAMLHVMGDLLGSVAALVAAVAIHFTGWTPIDPILSVLLSVLILRSAWALLKSSVHILMEGTPRGLEPDRVRADLLAKVPGLREVHHVHAWSITSGQVSVTLHVVPADGANPFDVVAAVKDRLAHAFGAGHSTVEVSSDGCTLTHAH